MHSWLNSRLDYMLCIVSVDAAVCVSTVQRKCLFTLSVIVIILSVIFLTAGMKSEDPKDECNYLVS